MATSASDVVGRLMLAAAFFFGMPGAYGLLSVVPTLFDGVNDNEKFALAISIVALVIALPLAVLGTALRRAAAREASR